MPDTMVNGSQWPTHRRLPELRRERRFHWQSDLLLESVRRQTFANWTVDFVEPDQLAREGFFYLQISDHVQCVFCQGIVGYWDPGDRPDVEHRKHFPNCAFVTKEPTGNVPLSHPADDRGRVYRLLDEYHSFRVASTRPVFKSSGNYHVDAKVVDRSHLAYRQFNTEASRKQTYTRWSSEMGVSVDALVAAGFFYTGVSDWVQCFHGGCGLFCWRKGDDPIADHARYYPWCPFIRTKKDEEASTSTTTTTATQKIWGDNDPPSAVIRPIALTDEEANLLLAHPIAQRLLAMGLSANSVKGALKQNLELRGGFRRTVSEALEVVFDFEENQQKIASPGSSTLLQEDAPGGTELLATEGTPTSLEAKAITEDATAQYEALLRDVAELRARVQVEERRLLCRECQVERIEVVLQPCSHLHLCATCARPRDICPTCSTVVRGTLKPIIS
ncbi:baculoviral IAP repeat-containing protein 7-like [Panulirus ornatus]|uniref:baculoviral IAP repeat-containing protein 7-like n=1 Tax=Panulirus ornatus TaxID=150431 RepID=UPI003A8A188A